MLRLTIWERLKIQWPGGSELRAEMADQHIATVSRWIERYLGVDGLDRTTRTEVFNVGAGQSKFRLRSFPVWSITSIIHDTSRVFTNVSPVSAVTYSMNMARGMLSFDGYYLTEAPGSLQVVYDGGIAADAESIVQMDDYLDLVQACEIQVLHMMTRAPHFGASSLSQGGGSRSFEQPMKLLPAVMDMLEPYRRPEW